MQIAEFISTRSRIERRLSQAATDVARARAALQGDDLQMAFTILSRMADGFVDIAPGLPAYVRTEAWKLLRNHGLRHGPDALGLAEEMLSHGLSELPDDAPERLRAGASGNLAILRSIRLGKAPSPDVLKSIANSYSTHREPELWATAQLNVADAMLSRGEMAAATQSYAAALRVLTLKDYPLEWARVQLNLGKIIQLEGQLADAVAIYRRAADVLADVAERSEWAAVQCLIGSALTELGIANEGEDGVWTLVEAAEAFRNALDVHREDTVPTQWALIREQLARAEIALADHSATTMAYPHLRAALQHLDVVLSVCKAGFAKEREDEVAALRKSVEDRLGGPGAGQGAYSRPIISAIAATAASQAAAERAARALERQQAAP